MRGELRDEKCGCHACDNGVQPGHFLCSQPSENMLAREQAKEVVRLLIGGPGSHEGAQRWAWIETGN